ncbi:MAG TPA: tRNA pseudouridine(38-40) synthase TruA [Pyrinomonadaceae bacterium]|jgi:tRNA pseudouridine38-40 synthase|nr:tRNA pseudouridine(38-40) synthase TruA [Pyrinomonadaceae bacterium]
MNYKLLLQYDGTDFHGWQIQKDLRTVQGELTRALSLINGGLVVVQGSGRTDAGVHAQGQVANVVLNSQITPHKLRAAINANVGDDLTVIEVSEVADDFHARYSARGKTYTYRIINAPFVSPFWVRYAHQEGRHLELATMQQCAALFLGEHDWTAFSSAQTDAESRVRTVTHCDVVARYEPSASASMVEITISAEGFLRYMVRSIVGTLLAAGRNEIDEPVIGQALETGDRSLAGATAPACGLTLLSVDYGQYTTPSSSDGIEDSTRLKVCGFHRPE